MTRPTCERLRELFDYDPDTGILTRRVRTSNRVKVGDAFGCSKSGGYLMGRVDGTLLLVHRVIWCWVFGEWPRELIDHRDTDGTNNRLGNLRDVGHVENAQNRHEAHRNNRTGMMGVSPHHNGFRAQILVRGKRHLLGSSKDPSVCAALYAAAKAQHHIGR